MFSKKSSFERIHPKDAEGKNPNLLLLPKEVEPSILPEKDA